MLLGLCSLRPQVGKTTVSEYLVSKYGYTSVEMSSTIENMAKKYFGYNGNKEDRSQRKMLQDIGLMAKTIDPHYWLYQAVSRVDKRFFGIKNDKYIIDYEEMSNLRNILKTNKSIIPENTIISGVRSPDEAEEIIYLGGKVCLISRGEVIDANEHKVESQLAGWDRYSFVIENNGTIEELYSKIDNILMEKKNE